MALTPKQQLFVKEYLVDLNATQAAIRAGYSKKTARQIGEQNLSKLDIAAEIKKAMDERGKRVEITADRVLQELAKLGFSNMADYVRTQDDGSAYVDLSDLTRDQFAAISEIQVDEYTEGRGEEARNVKRVKIKLSDKKSSLELLGKHLKLFTDKIEATGKDGESLVPVGLPELYAVIQDRAKNNT